MKHERYLYLSRINQNGLSWEEINEGWHFCSENNYNLIAPEGKEEGICKIYRIKCSCFDSFIKSKEKQEREKDIILARSAFVKDKEERRKSGSLSPVPMDGSGDEFSLFYSGWKAKQ